MLNFDFNEYPALKDYLQRIGDRPAFKKTIGARSHS
jgi:glutathione S-transferase